MPIKFLKDSKTFILSNQYFNYLFYVNHEDVLVHLYFGQPIHSFVNAYNYLNNITCDPYNHLDLKTGVETENYEKYFSFAGNLLEISPFLGQDKREPLVIIKHSDGSKVTDFRYVKHRIYKGKPHLENLPHIKENEDEVETLEIILKDRKDQIYIKMNYSIFKNKSVIVRSNEIINKTNKKINILTARSLLLDLPKMDYRLLYLKGKYPTDREIEEADILHGEITLGDNSGAKGFYHNPMMMIKDKTSDNVFGLGLIYSGNFKFTIEGTQFDQTRVTLGISDYDFEWVLDKKDSFVTPEAILLYSSNGQDEVTHTFHDLIRENLLYKREVHKEKTILLNSWEGMMFDFNTEKIISSLDAAKKLGVNLFVLDDGWFSNRNNDLSSLGDWWVNTKKIDLHKVIDHAHKLGMKFGLWVEPEMVSFNSTLFKNHPEYALFDPSINPTTLRHQLVLDLTNPEVRDYCFTQLEKLFSEYDVDYVKWDFNRLLTEVYSPFLPKEQQGEVFHRFTLGSYDLLSRFNQRFPHIHLETCSGGGGRFDMGMLYYSSQIWGSDETDAIQRSMIQYSTNIFYPLEVIGAHVSHRPHLSIKEKASIAIFGTFGYELDPTKLTDQEKEEFAIANQYYLDNENLIKNGDYYPLINPYQDNFVSWMVTSKDKSRAIVMIMNYRHTNWASRYLKLKGLDSHKLYKNNINEVVVNGDFYMQIGLNISYGRTNHTPELIILKEVK